ncbi:MAG: class I SAM-dependent methyltransferase [Oscillospiraceae bacterium]|nr:class I SAM-dependent methyltransferase [Oscillospiraceae bacterium]
MSISRAKSEVKLTKRLAAAAAAVREGSRVADVGCDHGMLAAWLVQCKKCAYAYAIDVSGPSLNKAADLFSSLGIVDKTAVMLSDGLAPVDPRLVDDVVIGGLGADTIEHIISRAEWLKDESKQLVLVPSSRHGRLRRFLCLEGFAILKETAVFEAGHAYTVMTVRYRGFRRVLSAAQAAFGEVLKSDGERAAYVRTVRRRCERIIQQATNAKDSSPSSALQEAREIMAFIETLEQK